MTCAYMRGGTSPRGGISPISYRSLGIVERLLRNSRPSVRPAGDGAGTYPRVGQANAAGNPEFGPVQARTPIGRWNAMARSPAPAVWGDDRLLVPYWLRAVRIGLWATVIVLVTLAVLP